MTDAQPHTAPIGAGLLPCPFCGGNPSVSMRMDENLSDHNIVQWTSVSCDECDVGFSWPPGVEPDPITQWNTRSATRPAPRGLDSEVVARVIDPDSFHLSDELKKPESDGFPGMAAAEDLASKRINVALAKADAILALLPARESEIERLRAVADAAQSLLCADELVIPGVSREDAKRKADAKLRQALGAWQAHHTAQTSNVCGGDDV